MSLAPNEIRPGEVAVAAPQATDAGLVFIGRIHTPWRERTECPRQGKPDGPICRIDLKPDRCAYTPVAPRRPGDSAD